MRVAIVTPNADPRDGALYAALSRRIRGVEVFAPRHPAIGTWGEEIAIHPMPTTGENWTRQWLWGLKGTLRAGGFDLIHVHNEAWAITTQRMLRMDRPVVVHAAESILNDAPYRYRLRRLGLKSALVRAAGYVSWGVTGLQAADAAGLPQQTPRSVIPASPPDASLFVEAPLVQADDGVLRLAFVGRLIPEKGIDDLLQGAAMTGASDRITITIVGRGVDQARLQRMACDLALNVAFEGGQDAVGVHRILVQCDALVVPSRDTPTWSEQWGRVAVEAMMTGRSVIVSDAGELPYLVPDKEWVFHQNAPRSLAHRIRTLLDNPSLVRTRAVDAYAHATRFRAETLAEQMLELWEQAVDQWPRSGVS